jgi:hypothetical protein
VQFTGAGEKPGAEPWAKPDLPDTSIKKCQLKEKRCIFGKERSLNLPCLLLIVWSCKKRCFQEVGCQDYGARFYDPTVVKDKVVEISNNIEGSFYAEGELKISAGANKSAKIQGAGLDVGLTSEIVSTTSENGANIIGNNKEGTFESIASIGIKGLDISLSQTNTLKAGEGSVLKTTSARSTYGVPGLGLGVEGNRTTSAIENSSTSIKGGVFTSFAIGTGWRISGRGSIGYKFTYQKKENE